MREEELVCEREQLCVDVQEGTGFVRGLWAREDGYDKRMVEEGGGL